MLALLKIRVRKEKTMAKLLSDFERHPLCQGLSLEDIISKAIMKLTNYPLLIKNLLKYTQNNTEEYSKLELALKCSIHNLECVNLAVKECENQNRLIDLHRRIYKKSIDNSPEMENFWTFDARKHKLLHEGSLIWSLNYRKQIEVYVVLLERALVLLRKEKDRLVLECQLVEEKRNSRKSPLLPLLRLDYVLSRRDTTNRKAFFVVYTKRGTPEIYHLVADTEDEQKSWIKYIVEASEAMKASLKEINQKRKPPEEEKPCEPLEQQGVHGIRSFLEMKNILKKFHHIFVSYSNKGIELVSKNGAEALASCSQNNAC